MRLRDMLSAFVETRSTEVLREIKRRYGNYGFSLACKLAGISRGTGKRLLKIYDDSGAIEQIAAHACGLRTSKIRR